MYINSVWTPFFLFWRCERGGLRPPFASSLGGWFPSDAQVGILYKARQRKAESGKTARRPWGVVASSYVNSHEANHYMTFMP